MFIYKSKIALYETTSTTNAKVSKVYARLLLTTEDTLKRELWVSLKTLVTKAEPAVRYVGSKVRQR